MESPVDGPFEDHFTSTSITIGNGLLGFVATFLLHPPRLLVRCQIGVLFHPAGEGDPSGLSLETCSKTSSNNSDPTASDFGWLNLL